MIQQKNTRGTVIRAFAAMALALGSAGTANVAQAANIAPKIWGTPPTSVVTGNTYSFKPGASDANRWQTLRFSIVNRPRWASFNSSTGRLSGTPTPTSAGEYVEIRIKVTDGRVTRALAPFSIVVRQANRAPKIGGTPATEALEGQAWEFKPIANDPDGHDLTFSISNRPAWANFDSSTGRLKGTPGTGTVGNYPNVTIRVSDGRKTTALPAFAVNVKQAALGSATLSWQAPTARQDGTPLVDLAGYRIRYGTAPDSFPNQVQLANAGLTTHVIENLPRGTYYFVATAYDVAGSESDFSAMVSKTIN